MTRAAAPQCQQTPSLGNLVQVQVQVKLVEEQQVEQELVELLPTKQVSFVYIMVLVLFSPSLGSESTPAPGNPTTAKGSGSVKQIVEIVLWISVAVHLKF